MKTRKILSYLTQLFQQQWNFHSRDTLRTRAGVPWIEVGLESKIGTNIFPRPNFVSPDWRCLLNRGVPKERSHCIPFHFNWVPGFKSLERDQRNRKRFSLIYHGTYLYRYEFDWNARLRILENLNRVPFGSKHCSRGAKVGLRFPLFLEENRGSTWHCCFIWFLWNNYWIPSLRYTALLFVSYQVRTEFIKTRFQAYA